MIQFDKVGLMLRMINGKTGQQIWTASFYGEGETFENTVSRVASAILEDAQKKLQP